MFEDIFLFSLLAPMKVKTFITANKLVPIVPELPPNAV